MHIIKGIEKGSIAEELDIRKGDYLISINNLEIEDALDYRFLIKEDYIDVLIEKANGEEWLLEIEKYEDEDLGLIFSNPLMDKEKPCRNNCMFCFIDQLPDGMRKTLYFKDDDYRLSFLQGNYVSLTNVNDFDITKIIEYRMSPMNISVHATDNAVREKLLNTQGLPNIIEQLSRLSRNGIKINLQIVLFKGVNDGHVLMQTLLEIISKVKIFESLSIVPTGITKYREGLAEVLPFTKEDAIAIIQLVNDTQKTLKNFFDRRAVFAADEFYLLAGLEIPDAEEYEEFYQIENGVGMIANFNKEFDDTYRKMGLVKPFKEISVVTGTLAYDFIKRKTEEIEQTYNFKINVYPIINEFFGETITVSGLLTGQDIIKQLKGKELGEEILVPESLLKKDETILLDDISIEEIEKALGTKVTPVPVHGEAFWKAIVR